jgi:hypothetical protein
LRVINLWRWPPLFGVGEPKYDNTNTRGIIDNKFASPRNILDKLAQLVISMSHLRNRHKIFGYLSIIRNDIGLIYSNEFLIFRHLLHNGWQRITCRPKFRVSVILCLPRDLWCSRFVARFSLPCIHMRNGGIYALRKQSFDVATLPHPHANTGTVALRTRCRTSASSGATVAPLSSWLAKAGHPCLLIVLAAKTWMAGTSPAMTMNHEVCSKLVRLFLGRPLGAGWRAHAPH